VSETLKRFITNIRSLFSSPEDEDPFHKMSDIEPGESAETEELTLTEAAGFEMERKVEG